MSTARIELVTSQPAPETVDTHDRIAMGVVVDLTATLTDQREDRLVAGQRRRLDTRARDLGRLLARRPELRGAHAPADLAMDGLLAGI